MASPDDVPLDDKAKRMRDLLSSFYSSDDGSSLAPDTPKSAPVDAINSPSFDPDLYMNHLVQKSNLEGLLHRHVEMAAEIKNLDTDLQMLVYENYSKFISATETIKRMKSNITGMETNMEQLLDKILSVQSRSDGVNTSLFEKRERIEKLHKTRNLLHKVQFIHDLPSRLQKCIISEAYADAVRFFTGAQPIFKAYGNSSFRDCKQASEKAMETITKHLLDKVYSDSEFIAARAEAVALLKQLNYPVETLKEKLLGNLELSLCKLEAEPGDQNNIASSTDGIEKSLAPIKDEVTIVDFAETVRSYQIIFPDTEQRLIELAQDYFLKRFEVVDQQIQKGLSSTDLMKMLGTIWEDVKVMDKVVPEAALPTFSLQVSSKTIQQYIAGTFSSLLTNFSDAFTSVESKANNDGSNGELSLQIVLERSKKAIIQGSMELLLDFRQLLADDVEVLLKLRDLIIDWVQEGFQNFFRSLEKSFHLFAGGNANLMGGVQPDKVSSGLILVLAQISVFVEQNAVPRITEEIASSFSGGGRRSHENGPAFVPGEICRVFRAAGEKFLQLYITTKTLKISVLLRRRFTMPNWIKHKEPREVHMFVDLLLHELEVMEREVKQMLPGGVSRKHGRSDSAGSTVSSARSSSLREDKLSRSHTQRARSQLLESHLAKLFKQKMEIFTKLEYTQESIISTIVKLCLKSLQEFVRLQTLNRSGFQQIQVDIQFLRNPLKEIVEDEAVVDFLLDEVVVAAAERCLDPIPLEPAILERLVQAKLTKG